MVSSKYLFVCSGVASILSLTSTCDCVLMCAQLASTLVIILQVFSIVIHPYTILFVEVTLRTDQR